jgi:hypothetical protein
MKRAITVLALLAATIGMASTATGEENAQANRWGGRTVRSEERYADGLLIRDDEFDAGGKLVRRTETYPPSFLAEEPVVLSEFYYEAGVVSRVVYFFSKAFIAASGGCYKETVHFRGGRPVHRFRSYMDGQMLEAPTGEAGPSKIPRLHAGP